MKYFFDIGMDEISETHLWGAWAIENRFINKNKHEEIFLSCSDLFFSKDGTFETADPAKAGGFWRMTREAELVYNPQLFFFRTEAPIAQAIITRLFTDNTVYKLTLYFSTGLELNLARAIV
jgi:hypothetical protein